MDNIKCKIYTFFYVLVLAMMPLLMPLKGYSQGGPEGKSVISDGSVLGLTPSTLNFSMLELSSTDRGFLLSRMTTAEREAIATSALVNGLIIYNTDTDCVEYYDAKINDWLSVCGNSGPADFTLANNSCNQIKVLGNYAKDAFLSPNENLMTIELTVTKPGSYNIRTSAKNTGNSGGLNQDNNYTFTAEGTFLQTGNFTVILRATGKPLYAGYARDASNNKPAGVGDKITMYFNNVEFVGCNPSVFIDPGAITFDVTGHVQQGKLYQGTEPTYKTPNATIDLTLSNIVGAGEVKFYTYDQNGLKFSATKFLSQTAGTTATVTLTGEGKSITPEETVFKIYNNSYLDMSSGQFIQSYDANVKIVPVEVEVLCAVDPLWINNPVQVHNTWKTFETIPVSYTITVPVKVIAPGKGRVKGVIKASTNATSKDVHFISDTTEFVFNAATNDIQYVVIKRDTSNPDAEILKKDVKIELSMESKGVNEYVATLPIENITSNMCEFTIPVEETIAEYSIDCSDVYVPPGIFIEGTVLNSTHYIEVDVNVTKKGKYDFETNTIDGIHFSGKANFTQLGIQKLRLQGVGTVGNAKLKEFTLKDMISDTTITNCTLPIEPVMKQKTMMSVGLHNAYGYTFEPFSPYFPHSYKFINSTNNFGNVPASTVKMVNKVITVPYSADYTIANGTEANNFRLALINNRVDVLTIGYDTYLYSDATNVVIDYLKAGGSVLAYTDNRSQVSSGNFLNALFGTTLSDGNGLHDAGGAGKIHSFLTIADEPVLKGPFRDMNGAKWGEDASNTVGISKTSLGAKIDDIIVLSTDDTGNYITAFRHKTYNLVWVGDGGFNSGSGTSTDNILQNICPFMVDNEDRPAPKSYGQGYQGQTSGQLVYNSFFTANALAWLFSVSTIYP